MEIIMEDLEVIKQKIYKVVLNLLPHVTREELVDDIDFFSLGLDSINITTFIWSLEDAFGVEFKANEISYENFRTIANTIELIKTKVSLP